MKEAVSIKKTTHIFLIITFFFASCELTKRKYTDGWYISKPSATKSITEAKRNERTLPKVSKQEIVEIANICNEEKAPDKELNLSLFRKVGEKKCVLNLSRLEANHDTVRKQNETRSSYNNKAFLIGEYTTFGLSLGSTALGFATLSSFVTLAIVFFASAVILFLISVTLSYIAIRKIRKLKLDHKIAPHAIIIGITFGVFCLVVAGIAALIAALVTSNPAIIILAALITFLLLMTIALSKI